MFYLDKEKLGLPGKQEPQLQAADSEVPDWPSRFKVLHQHAKDKRLQAFYDAGVVAGDTPLAETPLLAVDFETTGFNPRKNSIVSIGLVPMTLKRIRCHAAKHWIVKPLSGLSQESVVIHGITHSEIQHAPDLSQVIDELLQAFAGHVMVVHHRGIERPFLNEALKARLGEGIEFPVIDTMELEARLHRQKRLSWWQRFLGRQPLSIRLADSRNRYHLPWYRPHDALTDALATGELLQAQVAHRFTPETPINDLWK
ncbi:DNA polymerase-3 subunit epsilon [Marinospirillum celere]|uniref:DNA polymerase-3 subunit epsilon n=1 Tax=Marinospirillum celere TaxID=1122252 RepID=A0A1I1FHC3_9GAMM|nr:3'-5' exonuclease [Marinospirillum celere]SFB98889.1 DNA polymerase-3 subunit epsilon [Marinospirillum celere]